jgi:hypothetical protein
VVGCRDAGNAIAPDRKADKTTKGKHIMNSPEEENEETERQYKPRK